MGYSNTQKRGSPSLKEFSYTDTDYQSKWINAFISCSYSETSLNQTRNKAESITMKVLYTNTNNWLTVKRCVV
jgi:hypothetical protein